MWRTRRFRPTRRKESRHVTNREGRSAKRPREGLTRDGWTLPPPCARLAARHLDRRELGDRCGFQSCGSRDRSHVVGGRDTIPQPGAFGGVPALSRSRFRRLECLTLSSPRGALARDLDDAARPGLYRVTREAPSANAANGAQRASTSSDERNACARIASAASSAAACAAAKHRRSIRVHRRRRGDA